ncbi:YkgJ family cysteine cluster protein [Desulfuromonas sp. AOP6]|uniref:YkgJ family cysteine cluster protein n=1 Tax=Desulfuromonas sp. AOP6 TaxID=1566351 RepID=UPI001281F477|nr:YkgJ family cysteine cluster protein [Desulfuromonas sp. AOP6]BCA80974.1 hypothetical protein AOP6_2761 [Desulfuromonas sp. AOP6]
MESRQILQDYARLLASVDRWFDTCASAAGEAIACRKGCAQCCRGLFDITLLDALLLKEAFDLLPAAVRQPVLAKAQARLLALHKEWPQLRPPYILNLLPHEEWMDTPEDDLTPCPLLDEQGLCLIYEARPLTCRLHGLPHVDVSGEVFAEEWCTLNFVGTDPLEKEELRWHFRQTFLQQLQLMRELTQQLTGYPVHEVDTFIPLALLADFAACDWRALGLQGPPSYPADKV